MVAPVRALRRGRSASPLLRTWVAERGPQSPGRAVEPDAPRLPGPNALASRN